MTRYAADTSVPVDRSKTELERTLQRYGAESFMTGWDRQRAVVGFVVHDRQVRFVLPMPDRDDPTFTLTPTGRARSATQAAEAWEQAQRSAWRALNLVVKAKLEAVEAGIVTFEDEFMAHFVLPDGSQVRDHIGPALERAYRTGNVRELLPGTGWSGEP